MSLTVLDLSDDWKGPTPRCFVCGRPAYQEYCCLSFYSGCGCFFLCSDACHDLAHKAKMQLLSNQKRARDMGRVSTLSIHGWMETLQYFHFHCAYCSVSMYESIDHFVPIAQGGGTTKDNCLPACKECNYKKAEFYGQHLRYVFSDETYSRVLLYIKTVKSRQS